MSEKFKFSKKRIKERHSLNEIRMWLRELAYFKYFRAFGGHSNDGDAFRMRFQFEDTAELINIMLSLGFRIEKSESIYGCVIDYPDYCQPRTQTRLGVDWFLWVEQQQLTISLSGTGLTHKFDVTDLDFQACKAMEIIIREQNLTDNIDTTFYYEDNCISVENYPDLFKNL